MRVASIREHATIMHHSEWVAGIMVQVSKKKKADPILFSAEAKETARAAVEEVGGDEVGKALGIATDGEGLGIYRYASQVPGYRGWEWVVVLVTVPGSGVLTINEVSLQAGKHASLAPEWVPYEDRVQPGDLGPGDTLPPRRDDERLTAWAKLQDGDGFLRNPQAGNTLSHEGLRQARKRWREGKYGPRSEFAKKADLQCETCAFYLPIDDVENGVGVCANEYSADGRVVQRDYGCGAHSATVEESIGEELGEGTNNYGVYVDEGFSRFE